MLNQDSLHVCHRLRDACHFGLKGKARATLLCANKLRQCASRVLQPVRQMPDFEGHRLHCLFCFKAVEAFPIIGHVQKYQKMKQNDVVAWCVSSQGDW